MSLINSKYKSTNVRLYISCDIMFNLQSCFLLKKDASLSLYTQRSYRRHNVSQNLLTTCSLLILMNAVISLPDATSCDKVNLY